MLLGVEQWNNYGKYLRKVDNEQYEIVENTPKDIKEELINLNEMYKLSRGKILIVNLPLPSVTIDELLKK